MTLRCGINNCGYDALGYAILERAVKDIKLLQKYKLIQDGQATDPWPIGSGCNANAGGYSHQHEVKALIEWFTGGEADYLLSILSAPITAETICRQLRI